MATLLSTAPDYRAAGIHQYSKALLAHLPQAAPEFQFHAFVMDRAYQPPPGVRVHPSRWLTSAPMQRIVWEQTRVAWLAHRLGLHLLHGFAYALPQVMAVPAVVTVHDLTFLRFPDAFPRSRQRYLTWAVKRSCRQARAVIADSQATARDVASLLGVPSSKIHVVYPGVEERYRPLPPAEVEAYRRRRGWPDRFLLTVGTLEPRKNHLVLLEAYAAYRRKARQPLPLWIAGGKGWYYDQVFERVRSLGLEAHVRFLGFVPWEDLPWLYNAATLFLYPSRYEGFGLPLAEAMGCGLPAITSTASSLPEVAGDAALTLDPDDVAGMADAMWRVLEREPDLLTHMSEQGVKQAQRFRWTRTAAQTARVYARVLNASHA
jgi:glycosyltransferase involved in cell wall biosynthesis